MQRMHQLISGLGIALLSTSLPAFAAEKIEPLYETSLDIDRDGKPG